MRSIAVVTTSRADWGIYVPVLRAMQASKKLSLRLLVTGAHLSPSFGHTVDQIERDGIAIDERLEIYAQGPEATGPKALTAAFARAVSAFGVSYAKQLPDMLLLLGDRYEMLAAAVAALPFAIPIAHIHGGELTSGVIDEAVRHALTKMSHLHFVATETYRKRVLQLGEEAWRVTLSGAPALDQLATIQYLSQTQLEAICGLPLEPKPLVVTFHPDTLVPQESNAQLQALLSALREFNAPMIFTIPGADTGAQEVIKTLQDFTRAQPQAVCVQALGTQAYWSLLRLSLAMVGNSSSGIIEAPSFKLPVLNIGERQAGRVRAANVLDVAVDSSEILAGLRRVSSAEFRASLQTLVNPYGDGQASARIISVLESCPLHRRLLLKRFVDGEG